MLDPIVEQKMELIAENIFGSFKDPEQIPITKESGEKLDKLTPHWIKYELDDRGEPIAWVVVLPTSLELMNKFLQGKINERQLLDLTEPQAEYQAIYLCAAITVLEYRRQGLSIKLMQEAIRAIPHTKDVALFAWPYSESGRQLIKKLNTVLGTEIKLRG